MKLLPRVQNTLTEFENPRIPLAHHILLFFSAITLRTFLEIFSDKAKIPFSLFGPEDKQFISQWISLAITVFHYYFFWILLCLAAGIILHVITKESLSKVFRVVLPSFLLVIITPLFDLLSTCGKGNPITYVYPKTWQEFLFIPQGLTPGIICTSSTGLILAFLYCLAKTKNALKGISASLLLYLALMFLSVLPMLLGSRHPVPLLRVLFIAATFLLCVILYRGNRIYAQALAKSIYWPGYAACVLLFITGMLLTNPALPRALLTSLDAFMLTLLTLGLCWCACTMCAKIAGAHTGAPLSIIPQERYQSLAKIVAALALLGAISVNFPTFLFVSFILGNAILYFFKPLRIKRLLIFSKLLIAVSLLALLMMGFVFMGGELPEFPAPVVYYCLIFATLMMNVLDIDSYDSDTREHADTLPCMLGPAKAKLAIATVTLISYGFLGLLFLNLRLTGILLLAGILQFHYITQKHFRLAKVLLIHVLLIAAMTGYLAHIGNTPF